MDFKIPKKEHWNISKYNSEDFSLAKKFSEAIVKELPNILNSVVLFGSATRTSEATTQSDIDVLLIVNDVSTVLSPEFSEAFRIIVEKTASKVSKKFHINTLKLSNFWDYVRNGDPIVINMLRDGVPLYDNGIFEVSQNLLFQGRIRPTKESIWVYWARSPNTLQNSKWHILQAVIDLYWAAIDAAHAALMRVGEIPPTPSHVADMLDEKFANAGLLERKYVGIMRELHKVAKMIAHREVTEVTGEAYSKYLKETQEFVDRMKKIIEME